MVQPTRARPRECPDPFGFNLIVVGTPIYNEYPMKSLIEFLDRHGGLEGLRVVVFITCLAASEKIPSFIRRIVIKRYLGLVLKHVKGEVLAYKVFKGWIRDPDATVLRECAEWCRSVLIRLIKSFS